MAFFARLPGMAFFACEQDEREGALGMAPEVTVLVFIKVAQPSTPSRRDQFQRDDLVLKFKELARMRMVALAHPLWAELVQQEKIWSMLALRRWPNISPYILSLIHISEPTRLLSISYAVFCLKKKKKHQTQLKLYLF
eukprot:TRINITY_DN5891_c0_g1_i1.p1 TRINITY_DN5891_c0_g1~~TRINITY_DN5891_c0_g1_i1.p1  ORF type:complete len:138 (+),score=28.94 TRINITY_DN5891_c0_g1_i1:1-414(+)